MVMLCISTADRKSEIVLPGYNISLVSLSKCLRGGRVDEISNRQTRQISRVQDIAVTGAEAG